MTNLVVRLREIAEHNAAFRQDATEAADEIERLTEVIDGQGDLIARGAVAYEKVANEINRLTAGLQLIAYDEHRLMNVIARQTAASILSGKRITDEPGEQR